MYLRVSYDSRNKDRLFVLTKGSAREIKLNFSVWCFSPVVLEIRLIAV